MKFNFGFVGMVCGLICVTTAIQAQVQIGAELPLADGGSVDGWSGIPVMYGHELPAGESVQDYC